MYESRVNGAILGKESRPTFHLCVVAIEKGVFDYGLPNYLIYIYIYIYICIYKSEDI